MDKGDHLNCISLFSGCGGLDLGFSMEGFHIEVAADSDPVAVLNHKKNVPGLALQMDLASELPQTDRSVDLLIAGPPCQGFSTLGPGDPADPRNELLGIPAEVARALSPRFFLLENVPGVKSGAHAARLQRSANELKSLGYKVTTLDLEMNQFGVPQRRKRVIQLGWKGSSDFRFDFERRGTAPNLRESLENLDGLPNHHPVPLRVDSRSARIARRIQPGQKLCNVRMGQASVHTWEIPEVFGAVSQTEVAILQALARLRRRNRRRSWGDADPVYSRSLTKHLGFAAAPHLKRLQTAKYVRGKDGAWDLTHTFNGKYRRPVLMGLAPAVDTRFGDPHYVIHPTHDRAFTVREAARIQGFPDSFEFLGSLRDQRRMVANAVPPPVAATLAKSIRSFLALAQ
jgi:DNA (cytosine-5)-methyltransferase 1